MYRINCNSRNQFCLGVFVTKLALAKQLLNSLSVLFFIPYWPLYWLKMLARMPVNYDTWLGYGHSIPNGDPAEPLADNTRLCGVVLTPPLEDESFSRLTIDDKRAVYFWNLAPVYAEEMNFKLAQGADALLDRFSAADISDVVDVDRKNVCKKKRFGIF